MIDMVARAYKEMKGGKDDSRRGNGASAASV
jgi:hypothetical protein